MKRRGRDVDITVWVIEDDARYAARITTAIKLSFPSVMIRTLPTVAAVVEALEEGDRAQPHLVILDMILRDTPPGKIGGVMAWDMIRDVLPEVPILISTSEPELIPSRLHDQHTFVPLKTDLQSLQAVADSILVGQGLGPVNDIGSPQERWLWVTGGLSAAGGLWVASCLAVTSTEGAQTGNAGLIGLGMVGGAALGASSKLSSRARDMVLAAGAVTIISAGVLLPLLLL